MIAEESVTRQVLRLAFFAILTSFLQTFVFVVDRALLGHHSSVALGQMQISGTVEWSAFAVFSGFFAATFARIGRHVGAKDFAGATAAARLSVAFGVAFGAVLTLGTPLVLALIPRLAPDASAALHGEARAYLGITLRASPVVFVGAAAIAAIQAGGDTRTPLLIGLFTNAVHIAINWVLVLGGLGFPALGSRGAGIGTAITFTLEATLAIAALMRTRGAVSLRNVHHAHIPSLRDEARALVGIGAPAVLEKIVYQGAFLGFVAIIAKLGDRVMEANQSLIGLESVCFLSADGFGIAAAALVAQKIGAGKPEEASRVARSATLASVTLLGTIGVCFFLLRGPLVAIFTNDPGTRATGEETMWVFALAQPFMATGIVLAASLRGAGRTGIVFAVTGFSAFLVRLFATYSFAITYGGGLVGVWLGSSADWIVRTLLFSILLARGAIAVSGKATRSRSRASTPS